MDHLLEAWPKVRESIGRNHILLALDFDGTLVPIVSRPSEASLPSETRSLLRRVNEKAWCSVAIISGRALRGLTRRVGIEGLIYGGSHGARLSGPGVDFEAPLPEARKAMKAIASRLGRLRSSIPGVIIENKGECVAVHYRSVHGGNLPSLFKTVAEIVEPFLTTGMVRVRKGKEVLDVMPFSWDKGKAVLWLLDHLGASRGDGSNILPVYVGDDTTDEDAFAAIKERGLAVRVGVREPTDAQYYLRNISEVQKFLTYLLVDGRASSSCRPPEREGLRSES